MQCPSCHAQVDAGKFCPVCGASLPGSATGALPGGDSPSAAESLVGQSLGGKYKVIRLLGEGGMGCVYLGEQQLGTKARNVAIKTLHSHLSKDPKILARFEREVSTVAELEHPNTIQVFDFGKAEGTGILYIVMEFVQGHNLAETLEKGGAMEPARVERIMAQICGSLEEAHGRGIIHRDLKPDNIVLTERAGQKDFVKVLDFGIAKRSSEEDKNEQKLTQQGMVLGTPPYMSPEQFTGKPIDARSDIYSLAIMAYEMLTANLPFQANTAWEWATQHMTAPPRDIDTMPFHERIPARMKDALRRALAKAPEDRFPNVRAFLDAFTTGAGLAPAAAPFVPPGAPGKGRTEVGTPLDFGGAAPVYGSNPGPMSPPAAYVAAAQPQPPYGTPAQGNVAYPTPNAGIPQPPPTSRQSHEAGGGGNKGMILGVAAVIALVSIGAVVLGLRGRSSPGGGAGPELSFDSGSSATTTELVGIDAGAAPAIDSPPLAALDPGRPAPAPGHPAAHHDAGAGKEPPGVKEPPGASASAKGEPAPVPGPTSVPIPSASVRIPPPGRLPGGEPFQCVQAAVMKKAGNMAAYQQLKKACEAQGGTVPN